MSTQYDLSLRLHSGVPIVDVLGCWGPTVADSVSEMVATLTLGGHFEIVINVQRCLFDSAKEGVAAVRALANSVKAVRSHFGHLDLVGTNEQVVALRMTREPALFRLSASVEAAIGKIKRVPVMESSSGCTARLTALIDGIAK